MIDRVPRMAASRLIVLAMVVMLMLVTGASAQNSSDCTTATTTLTPCLTYIVGSDTTPGTLCCAAVSLLNSKYPDCLCQVVAQLNSSATAFVNVTKGYALPSACGVTANTSSCPALAPALAPAVAPSVAPSPPLFDFSPPPPATANSTSSPGSAAHVLRPSSVLATTVAGLGVSVYFSGFWVGAWQNF